LASTWWNSFAVERKVRCHNAGDAACGNLPQPSGGAPFLIQTISEKSERRNLQVFLAKSPAGFALLRRPSAERCCFFFRSLRGPEGPLFHGDVSCGSCQPIGIFHAKEAKIRARGKVTVKKAERLTR
jgi:hypothetical protein